MEELGPPAVKNMLQYDDGVRLDVAGWELQGLQDNTWTSLSHSPQGSTRGRRSSTKEKMGMCKNNHQWSRFLQRQLSYEQQQQATTSQSISSSLYEYEVEL